MKDETRAECMSGRRVLLVADRPERVRGLRFGLEEQDCAVTFAASVRQARQLLETDDFDLLITKAVLPDRTGVALLRDAHALGMEHLLLRNAEYLG